LTIVFKISPASSPTEPIGFESTENDRSLTNSGTDDTLVMVRIYTDVVVLQLEGKLTKLAVFQLVLM